MRKTGSFALGRSIGACLVVVLGLTSCLMGQASGPHLKRILGLSAESGAIALSGRTLSAFSAGDIWIQDPANLRWKLASAESGVWTVSVTRSGWRVLGRALPLSFAHGFAFCDRLNQVDVRSTSAAASAVPPGARVKAVTHLASGMDLVVYSESGEPVRYDIRVGLVQEAAPGRFSLLQDDLSTRSGSFCGVESGGGGVFFVFADEPTGSSDYSAVYAYAVTR